MAKKKTFILYSCKLRLEGNVLNEVPKDNISAAEIEMYRKLHGADAITDIKETGELESTDREERERIKSMFINPGRDAPLRLKAKTEMFRDSFGHDSLPMPTELAEDVGEAEEEDEAEAAAAPAPRVTRRATRTVAPEAASFTE